MSIPLEEALAQVDLEPGRTYHCQVKGNEVRLVVRVLDRLPDSMLPAPLVESDIMLDPWVEFPFPEGGIVLRATLGELPLPDPPNIPEDCEEL